MFQMTTPFDFSFHLNGFSQKINGINYHHSIHVIESDITKAEVMILKIQIAGI